LSNESAWHAAQKRRVLRILNKVDAWPQPLKALVGARLISLTNAIEALQGRPRNDSNHSVVVKSLGDLEEAVDAMSTKESAGVV
jgi:hypothetical protein